MAGTRFKNQSVSVLGSSARPKRTDKPPKRFIKSAPSEVVAPSLLASENKNTNTGLKRKSDPSTPIKTKSTSSIATQLDSELKAKDSDSDAEEYHTPKAKKPRKDPDPLWRKGGDGSNNPDALLNARNVRRDKIKSSVFFDPKVVADTTPRTLEKFQKRLEKKLSGVSGHRPLIVEEKESKKGVSQIFCTPDTRTPLFIEKTYGVVSVLGTARPLSSPSKPLVTQITDEQKKTIQFSAPFNAITPYGSQDDIVTVVTKTMLNKIKKEKRDTGGNRKGPSQAQAIKAAGRKIKDVSATQYGNLFIADMTFEILHFIAYMIQGSASQVPKNLACGSFHANTDMMFVEGLHPALAKAYPKGYKLTVHPHIIEETRLLTTLDYTITTPDFTLSFNFNCQTPVVPHVINRDYLNIFVDTCIAMAQGKLEDVTSPVKYNYFFSAAHTHAADDDSDAVETSVKKSILASPKR